MPEEETEEKKDTPARIDWEFILMGVIIGLTLIIIAGGVAWVSYLQHGMNMQRDMRMHMLDKRIECSVNVGYTLDQKIACADAILKFKEY